MPTRTQIDRSVKSFKRSYPKALPERLAWWVRVLHLDRRRILRLLGLSPEEIELYLHRDWQAVTELVGERAFWVEQLFREQLARFSYDLPAWLEYLRQPGADRPGTPSQSQSVATGSTRRLTPPLSDEELDRFLIYSMEAGGPNTLSTFLAFLRRAYEVETQP